MAAAGADDVAASAALGCSRETLWTRLRDAVRLGRDLNVAATLRALVDPALLACLRALDEAVACPFAELHRLAARRLPPEAPWRARDAVAQYGQLRCAAQGLQRLASRDDADGGSSTDGESDAW